MKYRQGIAIIDTADPILFRFLPRGDNGDVSVPARRVLDRPQTLVEAVQAMTEIKQAQKLSGVTPIQSNGDSDAGTITHGLTLGDVAQPDQRANATDSVSIRRQVRGTTLKRPLLPFEPPPREE